MVTKGSHRQYKHREKPGRVTIEGHSSDDLAAGTLNSVLKQAGIRRPKERQVAMHRFLIIVERARGNHTAYSPDLPGCIATGSTREQAIRRMHQAIEIRIEGLREGRIPIPKSLSTAEFVAVP